MKFIIDGTDEVAIRQAALTHVADKLADPRITVDKQLDGMDPRDYVAFMQSRTVGDAVRTLTGAGMGAAIRTMAGMGLRIIDVGESIEPVDDEGAPPRRS